MILLCTQRRLELARTSAHTDQGLRCLPEDTRDPWLPRECPAKPLIRLRGYARRITKTCLCNADHLKPHFYIVKLGFTGVNIIFLISAQKT